MKKALAIVLCVLAVCFASCNKEKPNQKFVGNYNGEMIADITISALGQSMPIDSVAMPLNMEITAGNKNDEVVAICTIEEEECTFNGIVNGDNVDFDKTTISKEVEGSLVDLTIDLNGTLAGAILNVNASLEGSGNVVMEGYQIPVTLTGKAYGALNKTDVIQ